MLGKLIKYDLKATYRLLVALHLVMLGASFLVRLTLEYKLYAHIPNVLFGLELAGYVILIVVVLYTTLFLLLYRFYRNLFTDEGYLTMTLPVTPGQHLLAKTISGSLWLLFDYFCLFLSLGIAFLIPDVLRHSDVILTEFDKALGMSAGAFFQITCLLGLISGIFGITFYYLCICIGQLFPKHRLLAAIIIFFALSTVIGILSMIVLLVAGFLPASGSFDDMDLVLRVYWISGILCIIQGIVSYILSYYIMTKKLNLE